MPFSCGESVFLEWSFCICPRKKGGKLCSMELFSYNNLSSLKVTSQVTFILEGLLNLNPSVCFEYLMKTHLADLDACL